jgi:hypothetical protein
MFRDRNPSGAYLQGVNLYVPGMQYASELVHGQPTDFSLGIPAAQDAVLFIAAGNAQTLGDKVVASDVQLVDSRYGRSLRLSISGDPGNAHVIDVYGFDYLGQPMVERFTGASGATAILYGKKAFYRVTKAKVVTASTNAVTYNLGTGNRLGLPFKGDIVAAKEAGVQVALYNRDFYLWADRSAAEAVAGGSKFLQSPCPGYVRQLLGTPNGGGSTTDPVITAELGGVAITGLTVTIDTSNAAGLTVTDNPTTPGYSANNRLVTASMIELVGAAAAGAGSDRVGVLISPTQFSMPDLTDPATATTGDPRGTYEAIMTYDGASEIIVSMIGNNAVNASNNGGLHGLKHFGG